MYRPTNKNSLNFEDMSSLHHSKQIMFSSMRFLSLSEGRVSPTWSLKNLQWSIDSRSSRNQLWPATVKCDDTSGLWRNVLISTGMFVLVKLSSCCCGTKKNSRSREEPWSIWISKNMWTRVSSSYICVPAGDACRDPTRGRDSSTHLNWQWGLAHIPLCVCVCVCVCDFLWSHYVCPVSLQRTSDVTKPEDKIRALLFKDVSWRLETVMHADSGC